MDGAAQIIRFQWQKCEREKHDDETSNSVFAIKCTGDQGIRPVSSCSEITSTVMTSTIRTDSSFVVRVYMV